MVYRNSRCSDKHAMHQAVESIIQGQVSAFIGPVCDFAVAPIAREVDFWKIPIISIGAIAHDFSDRSVNYCTLTRAGSVNLESLSDVLKNFLRKYSWKRAYFLYERNGFNHVHPKFCHFVAEHIVINWLRKMKKSTESQKKKHKNKKRKYDEKNTRKHETGNSDGEIEEEEEKEEKEEKEKKEKKEEKEEEKEKEEEQKEEEKDKEEWSGWMNDSRVGIKARQVSAARYDSNERHQRGQENSYASEYNYDYDYYFDPKEKKNKAGSEDEDEDDDPIHLEYYKINEENDPFLEILHVLTKKIGSDFAGW